MSIQDKVEVFKHILSIALKIVETIIKVVDSIIENVGGKN